MALRQLPLDAAEPRLRGSDWLFTRVAAAAPSGTVSLTTHIAGAPHRPSYDRILLRYQHCAVTGPDGRLYLFDAVDLQCRGVMGKSGRGYLDVPLSELNGCDITELLTDPASQDQLTEYLSLRLLQAQQQAQLNSLASDFRLLANHAAALALHNAGLSPWDPGFSSGMISRAGGGRDVDYHRWWAVQEARCPGASRVLALMRRFGFWGMAANGSGEGGAAGSSAEGSGGVALRDLVALFKVLKGARTVASEAGIKLADASQELGGAAGLAVMNFGGNAAAVETTAEAKARFMEALKDYLPPKVCSVFVKKDPELFAKKIDQQQPGFLAAVQPWMQQHGAQLVHSWVKLTHAAAAKARKQEAAKALLQEWGVE